MKRSSCFAVASTLAITLLMTMNFVACAKKNADPAPKMEAEAKAEVKPEVKPEPQKAVVPEEPPVVFGRGEVRTLTATVSAIDMKKRLVTLKKPGGEEFSIIADAKVKNLPQVKVGDEVTTKYYESISIRVLKADEPEIPQAASESVVAAPIGQKPAGIATAQVKTTATIMNIDKKKSKATLKLVDGKSYLVDVKHPENLDKVKVGDRIEIIYTESVALQVKAASKKKDAKKK
ncbi:DUF1344 domain-containing protein [Desulforegula conservatrix]|uniref:DUF1344 domain-containing protein n=1 Tax=Desulforegula conservatrix TaxID=153026 RepID=UPI00041C2E00|nr:DUF1344 domain-containing protein [Desulforegula conservatrix]